MSHNPKNKSKQASLDDEKDVVKNDVKDDSKQDEKQESKNEFVSPKEAEEMTNTLFRLRHVSQAEYFISVYWDSHCKNSKDEIVGILCKFVKTQEYRNGIDADEVN